MLEAGFTADMLAARDERPADALDEWLQSPSTSGRDADVPRPRHVADRPVTSGVRLWHMRLRRTCEDKSLL